MNLGETTMEKNKIKIFIPVIIIICLLGITVYKIIKNREENLYKSFYGEIKYAAKQCFLKENCKANTTLKELYDLKYLEVQYDPVTKEILDENINIEYNNEDVIIEGINY